MDQQKRNYATIDNKYIDLKKWGPPNSTTLSLSTEKIDPEALQDDEMLVKMKYASVNPSDMYCFTKSFGAFYSVRNNILPTKVGSEGAGVIEKVGSAIQDFKKGDQLAYFGFDGKFRAYQDYLIVKSGYKVPPQIALERAAQSVLTPLTALGILEQLNIIHVDESGNVKKKLETSTEDVWLALDGATASVSRLIIQLCKILGINTIAIVRKEDAIDDLKEVGATKVISTSKFQATDSLKEEIQKQSDQKGLQYAIDCVGGFNFEAMFESLTYRGQMAYYGNMSGQNMLLQARSYRNLPQLNGFNVYGYYAGQYQKSKIFVNYYYDQLQNGTINVQIEKIFDLNDYLKAFDLQINGQATSRKGRILLKMNT